MGNFFPIVEEYNMSSAKGGDKKPVKKTTKRRPQQKKKTVVKREKFIIDCTKPVTDQIMDISALEQYFHDKIKVNIQCVNIQSIFNLLLHHTRSRLTERLDNW